MFFLIHYDRSARSLVALSTFEDRIAASRAKIELELKLLQSGIGSEVVILEAGDEESLRSTHRRYFETLSSLKSQGNSAYSSSKSRFVKFWSVRKVQSGWLVKAEGVKDLIYSSKEAAIAAAAKDSRDWTRARGSATATRIWNEDGSVEEIASPGS